MDFTFLILVWLNFWNHLIQLIRVLDFLITCFIIILSAVYEVVWDTRLQSFKLFLTTGTNEVPKTRGMRKPFLEPLRGEITADDNYGSNLLAVLRFVSKNGRKRFLTISVWHCIAYDKGCSISSGQVLKKCASSKRLAAVVIGKELDVTRLNVFEVLLAFTETTCKIGQPTVRFYIFARTWNSALFALRKYPQCWLRHSCGISFRWWWG